MAYVGRKWADGLVVVLGYCRNLRGDCPSSMSGYIISSSGKVMVGMAVGAEMGVVVGVGFGSALVHTLSEWECSFNTL